MNITSVLLKKVILEADSETWSQLRSHYLPAEYHQVYKVINKYYEDVGSVPSFEALQLSIRNGLLLDKISAIQASEDVELDNLQLLEFLKNEYTQEEILEQISKFLDESIMIDSAKENLDKLQHIITTIEDKVDLQDPKEDMSRIELFSSEEELKKLFKLGLNAEFDSKILFNSGDYILIGGRRGAGKSLTCANIAVNEFDNKRSSLYFTIEMTSRSILQRMCAISTGVPVYKLRNRTLSHGEWVSVAKWWASRFEDGSEIFNKYTKHNSFDELHKDLTKSNLLKEQQLDVIYDPVLSLAKIRSELDKKVPLLNPSVILIDYVNQVHRDKGFTQGQYEWAEQIEVSKALKALAQEYEVPIVSPYQTDATGEARFAKGLLDSADAAFSLTANNKEDSCVSFECVKMRDNEETHFHSAINWETLKIGPQSAVPPSKPSKKSKKQTGNQEDISDL